MKQIDEAVQALACAIGFWRPSWILLKKLKNAKKKIYQKNSPGPVCILQIFGNNPSRGFRVRAETSGGVSTHIVGGDFIKITSHTNVFPFRACQIPCPNARGYHLFTLGYQKLSIFVSILSSPVAREAIHDPGYQTQ